jgi:hypothetical protein
LSCSFLSGFQRNGFIRRFYADVCLLSSRLNAAIQPQIRAQREFVGWNCLLGLNGLWANCIETRFV